MDLREIGEDPGDEQVLALAVSQNRILVTIDTDFGELIYARRRQHTGLVRLPDVRSAERITLLHEVLSRYSEDLEVGAVVTVRGHRIRVSQAPERSWNLSGTP